MTTQTLNSLAKASSAYLRSAMHQPIHWHEWGEEAFAVAARENKPVLLDIGAVWCHWCHVMDRESYEDHEIAEIVNERFVAIKVDRDERPDIDSRYQVAVQAVSGQGGWPLTAFLTPDGRPFFGGTYFPPEDQYGRPSMRRVLLAISDAYRNKNGDVMEQAQMVENAIAHSESHSGQSGTLSKNVIDEIVQSAVKSFDPENGGFGSAPKFPHPSILDLLIDRYARTGDENLHKVFAATLEKMANGGVYDQLAGGFHRYSVDEHWIVPHFEKMSYDNSELLKNFVHAYQVTGSKFFSRVARDILRWMDEWLTDREHGGFYASQDADYSLDDDGDYFTWTVDEAREVLTAEEFTVASLHYDINEVGEMHHNPAKNVLYVRASLDEIGKRLNLPEERVAELLDSAKNKMYAARLKRPTPFVDKTVYTSWNALCSSAYLQAARVFGANDVRAFALRSLDRILSEGWKPQTGFIHVIAYADSAGGHKPVPGVLDDYAFMAVACLDAYEATSDLTYFHFARQITDVMIAYFFDNTGGGFCDTPLHGEGKSLGVLGTRRKPFQDSPTPAGNSMAAIALLRIHALTGEADYRDKAEQTLEIISANAETYGIYAATYAAAAIHFFEAHTQMVVIGDDGLARELEQAAISRFAFNKSVLRFKAAEAVAPNLPPALAQTIPAVPHPAEHQSFAVLCENFACQLPITSPEQIKAASSLRKE